MNEKKLKYRVFEVSKNHNLSHIGSCITALPIIAGIYEHKEERDIFILSSGHAGLALYVVLEEYENQNADWLFRRHGVHPNRDMEYGIHCSTGSLGHGLGIAVGMALADPTRQVYVLLSDGEMAEGSVWEALNFLDRVKVPNLHIHVNANGYSAYERVHIGKLIARLNTYDFDIVLHKTDMREYVYVPGLQGLSGHYYALTDQDYELLQRFND